mmetsp:Transcript_6920/g.8420  ORF Transcript_6920/g.8420 Transcript_6920/m.8420 type:complete len:158 (-) Transcript_6920:514-987(-)
MASTRAAASSSAATAESVFFPVLLALSETAFTFFVGTAPEDPFLLGAISSSLLPSLEVLGADLDLSDITAIISSTFFAAYFSAAWETSDVDFDDEGAFCVALFLSRNAFQASEEDDCLELVETSEALDRSFRELLLCVDFVVFDLLAMESKYAEFVS